MIRENRACLNFVNGSKYMIEIKTSLLLCPLWKTRNGQFAFCPLGRTATLHWLSPRIVAGRLSVGQCVSQTASDSEDSHWQQLWLAWWLCYLGFLPSMACLSFAACQPAPTSQDCQLLLCQGGLAKNVLDWFKTIRFHDNKILLCALLRHSSRNW